MPAAPHLRSLVTGLAAIGLAGAAALVAPPSVRASAPTVTASVGPPTVISSACRGQNAEVEQAVDRSLGYVYEDWMGCTGIGFARSTDGGRHFSAPIALPGAAGLKGNSWDPAITVAPDGTVYASFMQSEAGYYFPVVAASFDHGKTFPQLSSLIPPHRRNWGDRDFIAVGPDGAVYVTWDYGPDRSTITYICDPTGSCSFSTGQLNVVVQTSTNRGRTWGPIVHVSPGFPASGGDSAPILVEPDGSIDVLYQGYRITNRRTYALSPAHSYFTSSRDGGQTWSAPVLVGADRPRLTMSLAEWWIDGSLARDAAGNLYATWDTQGSSQDVGWLAFSRDHGRHWSGLVRVTPDNDKAPHIVEVIGGRPGIAYVGWLTSAPPSGYAQYLRAYSIDDGWLDAPISLSGSVYGDPSVWPGDTFGISTLGKERVVVSWGSAVPLRGRQLSEIFVAVVRFANR